MELEQSIIGCPLFEGMALEELSSLLKCLAARRASYKKDAFIFEAGERAELVGIVISGRVNVIHEDFWGNRSILTHAVPGELFAEAFSCAETAQLPISVVAAEPSEILLIDYRRIVTTCSAACLFHARLIANMLRILADKNIQLTHKMGHISKRTTREKLLSFLSARAVEAGSNSVSLPFNRQELADFLSVERSALSRELGAMKREGLIDYKKNQFVLH